MHYWEANRILKSPIVDGVQVSINFGKLTTRMNNAVKRGLQSGMVKGGYSSESVRLAQIMAIKHGINIARCGSGGFTVTPQLVKPIKEELLGLVRADLAAYMLEHGGRHWAHTNMKNAIKSLENDNCNWVPINHTEFWNQARDLIATQMQDEERNRRVSEACEIIDSGATITIQLKGDSPWQ